MANTQIAFRPKLEGELKNRFYDVVSKINASTPASEILAIADQEIKWVENECFYNLDQRKKYRAIWYLLRDLINAS